MPGSIFGTIRDLTLDDAEALLRVPGVEKVVPVSIAVARAEHGGRGRDVYVYGVTSDVPAVWKFHVRQGSFLPAGDPRRAPPVAVLGTKLKRELFGEANALGGYVRIGGQRFQVIGILEPKGRLLGFDLDDTAYIPVSRAQELVDKRGLFEIDVLFSPNMPPARVAAGVTKAIQARHRGEEDSTVITQSAMLSAFRSVLDTLTAALAGIAAISLAVAGIGLMNVDAGLGLRAAGGGGPPERGRRAAPNRG